MGHGIERDGELNPLNFAFQVTQVISIFAVFPNAAKLFLTFEPVTAPSQIKNAHVDCMGVFN
jgi:hypothetical protein